MDADTVERLWTLSKFFGLIALLAIGGCAVLVAFSRVNGDDDDGDGDDDGIGLGADASAPPLGDLLADRRPRADALARAGEAFATVRVRMDARRLERERIRPFLSGPPVEDDPLDLDALAAAADRLKQSAQRCAPRDAA